MTDLFFSCAWKKGGTWKLEQEKTLLSHGHIWIAVNDFLNAQKIVLGGTRVSLLNQTGDPDKAEWIINEEPENFSNSVDADSFDDSHVSKKRKRTPPPDDHSRFGFSEFHFQKFLNCCQNWKSEPMVDGKC